MSLDPSVLDLCSERVETQIGLLRLQSIGLPAQSWTVSYGLFATAARANPSVSVPGQTGRFWLATYGHRFLSQEIIDCADKAAVQIEPHIIVRLTASAWNLVIHSRLAASASFATPETRVPGEGG